jgi:4-oxalocrotonate tautomerase
VERIARKVRPGLTLKREKKMPEVQVFLAEGRTDEQKKGMMLDITHALVKNLGVASGDVIVQIVEAKLTNKMKGGQTFVERLAKK